MKSLFLATLLALCSCATGSTAELPDEAEEVYVAPVKKPAPKAPEPEPNEDAGTIAQCKIDAYWVGNCYVVKIYCKDKPTQVEVACGPPRPLWPWERDPYPPPYDNRK